MKFIQITDDIGQTYQINLGQIVSFRIMTKREGPDKDGKAILHIGGMWLTLDRPSSLKIANAIDQVSLG